jgi:protein involved in polysaccharide export with SLBB domain
MKARYCLLPLLVLFAGCASTVSKESLEVDFELIKSLNQYRKEYILAPGDQLEVMVYRNPELSRTVLVRPDGYISVPVLDDVKAAGLTVPELDKRLTDLFERRLIHPEVTVIVNNAQEPMVYVVGEVGQATPVPLRQAKTAAQAISRAGGLRMSAAKGSIAIVRLDEEGRLVAHVVKPKQSGQPAFYMVLQSIMLQPDDLIIVPESNRSQFVRFVQDFVTTPLGGLNSLITPYFQLRLIDEELDN